MPRAVPASVLIVVMLVAAVPGARAQAPDAPAAGGPAPGERPVPAPPGIVVTPSAPLPEALRKRGPADVERNRAPRDDGGCPYFERKLDLIV